MGARLDPTNLPPGTLIQGYRVVRKLGQGSYGAVYLVVIEGRYFALKLALHRAGSGDAAQTDARLLRELTCLTLLQHPHIVRVWAHGRWQDPQEGLLFIVMDYVEGYTLAEWMEHTHPTFRELLGLLEKVAAALEDSHARGVLHRDLKPSNLLVRKRDNAPFLTDYSVGAHPLAEELTEGPLPPGTRRYRSPEALKFERQHRQEPEARYAFQVTDEVFALGASLYDMLTDPRPSSKQPRQPLNSDALPPPSPATLNPRVPPALSDLTMALLNPDPRVRPPTAGAVSRMLGELRADPDGAWDALVYPPSARRAGASPTLRIPWSQLWRRWRLVSALGAALLALALAAAVFSARWGGELPRLPQAERPPPVRPLEPPASPAPEGPPPASSPPSSQKEQHPMSLARSTPEASPPPSAEKNSPEAPLSAPRKPSFKRCAALIGTLTFLEVGCATVHLRPEPGACPEEAVNAMRKRHFPFGGGPTLIINPDRQQLGGTDLGVYENGPTTGIIFWDDYPFPEGTLLDGHLWVSAPGNRVFGRFTLARLPGGETFPVCFEICSRGDEAGLGWEKVGPGPRPGTVLMMQAVGGCPVDRWH